MPHTVSKEMDLEDSSDSKDTEPEEEVTNEKKLKVPTCMACQTLMTPRTVDGDWFWGCPRFPECRGPTRRRPEVPEVLKEAVRRSWKKQTKKKEEEQAKGCTHSLTRDWHNGSGSGTKCLLCKAEIKRTPAEEGSQTKSKGQKAKKKEEQEQLIDQVNQIREGVLTISRLLEDATKKETTEATRKALLRTVNRQLTTEVATPVEIMAALLETSDAEKGASAATASGARGSGR